MNVLFKIVKSIKYFLFLFINPVIHIARKNFHYLYLRYYGVETKYGYVTLMGLPIIHKAQGARIIIGPGTTLISKSKYNSAGVNHPVILGAVRKDAVLHIHGGLGASGSAIVAMKSVILEEGVGLGANADVYDTDFHPVNPSKSEQILAVPVRICKRVWVGGHSKVLKGVTIGENSVIGAGSIVTRDVEPNSLYAGVPAKKIKDI